MEFLKVVSKYEAVEIIRTMDPLGVETLNLEESHDRVLAEEAVASEDVPHFKRATMDGYAVRARDTFGASESLPAMLTITGSISVGQAPYCSVGSNEAVPIPTGGALPEGADAVVMVEHTEKIDEKSVEIFRPVAPGENTLQIGEDIRKGNTVFCVGKALKPQDIGTLAALGIKKVKVYKRPEVAIVSTGDEIVPFTMEPPLPVGVIRDINALLVDGLCKETGAIVKTKSLVKDDLDNLSTLCRDLINDHDVVLISGGSSIGVRDFTLKAIERLAHSKLLFHGVGIKPGKPSILCKIGSKYLWGLPGQPASAMMVMVALVCPFLRKLQGESPHFPYHKGMIPGILRQQIPSVHGREDYIPVRIHLAEDLPMVEPIFGKSGAISTLSQSDGFVVIPEHAEGLEKHTVVTVYLF